VAVVVLAETLFVQLVKAVQVLQAQLVEQVYFMALAVAVLK
jgi:hypothetical protein